MKQLCLSLRLLKKKNTSFDKDKYLEYWKRRAGVGMEHDVIKDYS